MCIPLRTGDTCTAGAGCFIQVQPAPGTIAASCANETDVQYTLHNANKSKIGHFMQLAHNQRVEF